MTCGAHLVNGHLPSMTILHWMSLFAPLLIQPISLLCRIGYGHHKWSKWQMWLIPSIICLTWLEFDSHHSFCPFTLIIGTRFPSTWCSQQMMSSSCLTHHEHSFLRWRSLVEKHICEWWRTVIIHLCHLIWLPFTTFLVLLSMLSTISHVLHFKRSSFVPTPQVVWLISVIWSDLLFSFNHCHTKHASWLSNIMASNHMEQDSSWFPIHQLHETTRMLPTKLLASTNSQTKSRWLLLSLHLTSFGRSSSDYFSIVEVTYHCE